jgi:hypothetical protein
MIIIIMLLLLQSWRQAPPAHQLPRPPVEQWLQERQRRQQQERQRRAGQLQGDQRFIAQLRGAWEAEAAAHQQVRLAPTLLHNICI